MRTRVAVSAILMAPEYQAYNESRIASDVLLLEWVFIVVAAGAAWFFHNGEAVPASECTTSRATILRRSKSRVKFHRKRQWLVFGAIGVG